MAKQFTEVNKTANKAQEQFERTFKIYNFLKEHKGEEFRPKELAKELNYILVIGGHVLPVREYIEYSKMVHPLCWLKNMGLVDFKEYEGDPIKVGYKKAIVPTVRKWYAL